MIWDFNFIEPSKDVLKSFCKTLLLGTDSLTERSYITNFTSGFYEISDDPNVDFVNIGVWPKFICDEVYNVENCAHLDRDLLRFDMPENILDSGIQDGSFFVVDEELYEILYKISSKLFLMSGDFESQIFCNYTLVRGSHEKIDKILYDDVFICEECNFITNVYVNSEIILETPGGDVYVEISEILENNAVRISSSLQIPEIISVYYIHNVNKNFKKVSNVISIGSSIFLDGFIELGEYVLVTDILDEELVSVDFWHSSIYQVIFSDIGIATFDSKPSQNPYSNITLTAYILYEKPSKYPCPSNIDFSESYVLNYFSSSCTCDLPQDFYIHFIAHCEEFQIFIDFYSDKPLFRVVLSTVSYVFSYSDYSVKKFNTPFIASELIDFTYFVSVFNGHLYVSQTKILTNLLFMYWHEDMKMVKRFEIGSVEECTVSSFYVRGFSEVDRKIFLAAHEYFDSFYNEPIVLELEDGENCEDGFFKTKARFRCGEYLDIEEVIEISPCEYKANIISPIFCSKHKKEYNLKGPTLLIIPSD
ncbi:hypothetical protein SteCoe_14940 [Stentor coeruleus]|uniref:Uncharacterized protein n=1 Tax=Stentor coeruleus TaxID=5963 RepID=A0A1R2C4U7_9CILI|nr:hypothetical protein SteCoe_14940 [Stentor coeruleus]